MSPDVARAPESRCLNCGKLMNMLGTGDPRREAHPHPGDAVMLLDDQLALRGMTDAEMDTLQNDREWMDNIARMVQRVYFVRAKRN